jgi:hypothetical protein
MKSALFFALSLLSSAAAARDVGQIPAHPDPSVSAWFRSAKSPSGYSCCDEADGFREGAVLRLANGEPAVIFQSWWAAADGYHLSVVDPANLRSLHLVWNGPVVRDNPTGGAVVWLWRAYGILTVRCFSPGPQS